ncbi:class I SAM-dependent DNA methyltransferase (plasmid) [Pseudonocardia bannensis]|uniref:Class I SAM-dependent methyltransferase n=1 Tax=Pseudonocardia bannensis TaxID=630973 RepID=A0A848DRK1_9PSEU|nr:class I SAM-dependent methyltransferase [Pseudonocardia bannensis]NMH95155.1 class I SAM-dependent methyltransferase [Pseudonocardia bannensis]
MSEPSFLDTTREAYDAVAAEYAEHFRGELDRKPQDRAILGAFAELVRADGPVLDVGCGPGQAMAHLRRRGVAVFGLDLSPGMVDVARWANPGVRIDVGSMTALDRPDGALGGLVAWYSIIHIPPEELPGVFAEFHRVLVPRGHLLLAFQVGDDPLHLDEAFGHAVDLDFRRLRPDRVADLLADAGFDVLARTVREPVGAETVEQAFLVARKRST